MDVLQKLSQCTKDGHSVRNSERLEKTKTSTRIGTYIINHAIFIKQNIIQQWK